VRLRRFFAVLLLLLTACASHSDAPFVGTPELVIDEMLRLAQPQAGDVLYDLGSGDGRIPIVAAQRYGIRAVGIERDAQLVARAQAAAERAGVAHLVRFRREDLFDADFSEATVVTLYLQPWMNAQLRPRLQALAPSTRIVAHQWGIAGWDPERAVEMEGRRIYLWTVPPR